MGQYKVNSKDIFFILNEQLDYSSLCSLERYKDLDKTTMDMLVSEAIAFAKGVVDPLNETGEEHGVLYENNEVKCHRSFQKAYSQYCKGGWIAAARDEKHGGGGFPLMMRIIINDFMYGACQSFNMAPSLTHGAAHLIESFASEPLKELFVPEMYNGKWAGTMALTEPNAGSNLGEIETCAYPEKDYYKIKGSKIFISWGEHDLTQNIIHLVLARIEGAPRGVKGISLFIVPKIKVNPDGSLGEKNDVTCTGIEDKLGLHASPTCSLSFGSNDDCIGYLCGEENKGLAHMFQMMNQARINASVSGMSIANTAYLNALAYTKEREQGRDITGKKQGQIPLIEHPDIRRMLLWMKAVSQGMRSMIYTAAFWSDIAQEDPDSEKREFYNNLLEFTTPILKAYCSDMGFRVCETAMQCLGGYGYCKDYPVEQYLRDVKIMSLYEGTNGIQAMDLMGRKLSMKNGNLLTCIETQLEGFCQKNKDYPGFEKQMDLLAAATKKVCAVSRQMAEKLKTDPLYWASNTYPALMAWGDLFISWRLLDMAVIASKTSGGKKLKEKSKNNYLLGKVLTAKYFVDITLPKTLADIGTCIREGREIIDMPEKAF